MAATYTVKTAKNAGVKDNPHGGQLSKLYLTVTDEQGNETSDVYCQRKVGNEPNPGDTIYGRLEQGEYGWRLYPEQNPNGAQGRSERVRIEADGKLGTSYDDRSARIERQHSQEMALHAIAIMNPGNNNEAWNVEPFREMIRDWTNWFAADVGHAKGADVGGGNSSPPERAQMTPAPAADVSAKGFTSDKQRDFFERLLREAGAKPETVNAIVLYASEALSGRQGGAISEAISGLKADDPSVRRSTGKTLALAAEEWRNKQSVDGPPPDTAGLPEINEQAPVGAADDDIPF